MAGASVRSYPLSLSSTGKAYWRRYFSILYHEAGLLYTLVKALKHVWNGMGHQQSSPHLFLREDINGEKEHYTNEPDEEKTLDIVHHPERIARPSLDSFSSELDRPKATQPHPTDVYRCSSTTGVWKKEAFNPRCHQMPGIYYGYLHNKIEAIAIVRHKPDANPSNRYMVRFSSIDGLHLAKVDLINKAIDHPRARMQAEENQRRFPSAAMGMLIPRTSLSGS